MKRKRISYVGHTIVVDRKFAKDIELEANAMLTTAKLLGYKVFTRESPYDDRRKRLEMIFNKGHESKSFDVVIGEKGGLGNTITYPIGKQLHRNLSRNLLEQLRVIQKSL